MDGRCPYCGVDMTTGGCPNQNCPSKIGSFSFTTHEIPSMPLDAWVDEAGLRPFVEKHVKIHLAAYGHTDLEDQNELARLIMISLRQELQEAGWLPPTRYVFQIYPDVTVPVSKPEVALVVKDGERLKFVCGGCGREMQLAVDKRGDEPCDVEEPGGSR